MNPHLDGTSTVYEELSVYPHRVAQQRVPLKMPGRDSINGTTKYIYT
jgi:hypothetical protein